MYLEINNRQSGKTTRLIQSVVRHLINGGTAFVFTHNMSWAKQLERRIKDKLNEVQDIPDEWLPGYYKRLLVRSLPDDSSIRGYSLDARRFWDEYVYIPYVEWRDQDYYCTSPRDQESGVDVYIRDDDNEHSGNEPKKEETNPSKNWEILFEDTSAVNIINSLEAKRNQTKVEADHFEEDGSFVKFYNEDGEVVHAIKQTHVVSIRLMKK